MFTAKKHFFIVAGVLVILTLVIMFLYSRYREMKVKDIVNAPPSTAPTQEQANIAAFLKVIRYAEGTTGANGYRTIYGGSLFTDMSDHPRQLKCYNSNGKRICSDAAGAYQFLSTTWDEVAAKLGLTDFSEKSQDAGAVQKLEDRGALDYVLSGDFENAIKKCAKEWASLPYSPYGQPTKSMSELAAVFSNNGGQNIA